MIKALLKKIIYVAGEECLDLFQIRRLPRVIQMPITGKCNSRCVTCNVWKHQDGIDMLAGTLCEVLRDPFFSKVQGVGINGGELTLHNDVEGIFRAVLTLPRIKQVSVISNGLITKRLKEILSVSKRLCEERGVSLILTLSIDGVGEVDDLVRGVAKAYERTVRSLKEILSEKEKYCDTILIGCTISRYNVAYLPQMEQLGKDLNVPIEFHLAVPNKRIHTFEDSDRYNVLVDEHSRLLATEFFYKKMEERNQSGYDMMRYFMQYDYLMSKGTRRLALCSYQYKDVTIDEHMNLYLCATASDNIGNLTKSSVRELRSQGKFQEIEQRVFSHCNQCVHYCWQPSFSALWLFFVFKMKKVGHLFPFKIRLLWTR